MFLAHILKNVIDLDRDMRVLDLSAAPGGKSTHLQTLITKNSLLVANEVIGNRNKILRQNLSRWGGDNHIVTQSDPRQFKKLPNFFDVILVDAPCSGEGLMRKDHAAIAEWSEDNVAVCSSRQKRILADIVPALANNGILIYSTCTYSVEENEENMLWLERESGLIPIQVSVPSNWGIVFTGPSDSYYRFYPHHLMGEGFFMAAFRKPASRSSGKSRVTRSKNDKTLTAPIDEDKKWLTNPQRYNFLSREDHRIALPRAIYDDYLTLSKSLRITSSGLNMGKVYHNALKPSPELALSQVLAKQANIIDFSKEKALDYLAHINQSHGYDYEPGYNLVVFDNHGLGWMHVLHTGQIRNKYPAAWRILQRTSKK